MHMIHDSRPAGLAILDKARLNRVFFAIATTLIYFALDQISYVYPLESLNITPWSPDRSFVVALILFYGAAWVVWVYLTIFIAELAFSEGVNLDTAELGILVGSGLAAVVAYAMGRIILPSHGPDDGAATDAEAEASTAS